MLPYMAGLQLNREDTNDFSFKEHIHNNSLVIHVRPCAPKTMMRGWDDARGALRVDVAAAAEKDKANKEIIKFFSKLLKTDVIIIKGERAREKVLKVIGEVR